MLNHNLTGLLRQRADLLKANIWANKISLPKGQSYTERKYLLTTKFNLNFTAVYSGALARAAEHHG